MKVTQTISTNQLNSIETAKLLGKKRYDFTMATLIENDNIIAPNIVTNMKDIDEDFIKHLFEVDYQNPKVYGAISTLGDLIITNILSVIRDSCCGYGINYERFKMFRKVNKNRNNYSKCYSLDMEIKRLRFTSTDPTPIAFIIDMLYSKDAITYSQCIQFLHIYNFYVKKLIKIFSNLHETSSPDVEFTFLAMDCDKSFSLNKDRMKNYIRILKTYYSFNNHYIKTNFPSTSSIKKKLDDIDRSWNVYFHDIEQSTKSYVRIHYDVTTDNVQKLKFLLNLSLNILNHLYIRHLNMIKYTKKFRLNDTNNFSNLRLKNIVNARSREMFDLEKSFQHGTYIYSNLSKDHIEFDGKILYKLAYGFMEQLSYNLYGKYLQDWVDILNAINVNYLIITPLPNPNGIFNYMVDDDYRKQIVNFDSMIYIDHDPSLLHMLKDVMQQFSPNHALNSRFRNVFRVF